MFGTKHLKTNWLQKTIKYQTNERLQNIQIEIWKCKAVMCTNITLNYIKQAQHN